jgi:hypothetical protein
LAPSTGGVGRFSHALKLIGDNFHNNVLKYSRITIANGLDNQPPQTVDGHPKPRSGILQNPSLLDRHLSKDFSLQHQPSTVK